MIKISSGAPTNSANIVPVVEKILIPHITYLLAIDTFNNCSLILSLKAGNLSITRKFVYLLACSLFQSQALHIFSIEAFKLF